MPNGYASAYSIPTANKENFKQNKVNVYNLEDINSRERSRYEPSIAVEESNYEDTWVYDKLSQRLEEVKQKIRVLKTSSTKKRIPAPSVDAATPEVQLPNIIPLKTAKLKRRSPGAVYVKPTIQTGEFNLNKIKT